MDLTSLMTMLFGGGTPGAPASPTPAAPQTGPSLLPNSPTSLGAMPTTALQAAGPMTPAPQQNQFGAKVGEALMGGLAKNALQPATPPQPQMNMAQSPQPRVGGPPGGTAALGGTSVPSIDAYIRALMQRSSGRM